MGTDVTATAPRLALVKDATNIDCGVVYVNGETSERVRYSASIQDAGVVIRNCHVVVVDHQPAEITWRVGTIARVVQLEEGIATYDDGWRGPQTAPFKDSRPEPEQQRPIAVGDTVLLQGHREEMAVADTVIEGRIAHPDRLTSQVIAAIQAREQRR
jgi:hypothetical protein